MDWKQLINSVAPMIGMALGGPLGASAVGAVADALGLSEKTEEAVKSALAGVTPEQMLVVKNADHEFALKMQELGFKSVQDLEALAVSDRESARHREETVLDNTPKILAYLLTLGFFLVLGFMLFGNPPMASRDILNILMGVLGTAFTGVINYYFGSSSGSAAKTALLAKAPAIVE